MEESNLIYLKQKVCGEQVLEHFLNNWVNWQVLAVVGEFTLLPIKFVVVNITYYFTACYVSLVINFTIDWGVSWIFFLMLESFAYKEEFNEQTAVYNPAHHFS